MEFEQIFKPVSAHKIFDHGNLFDLVGKDFFVITAGKSSHYNSMTGSGGGFGLLFRKPTTWCVIRADRYTLEVIKKEQTYTLSYFSGDYYSQIMFLGSKSGRDGEKMKEVGLTSVELPSGNISFKEARLVIECGLTQISTPLAGDFYGHEAKEYFNDAYSECGEYRKYVFGEITSVWVK